MGFLLGLFGINIPAKLAEILTGIVAAGIAALVVHLWWNHHNAALVAQGVHQQQDADDKASALLKQQTDAKTADLKQRVATEEIARAKADLDLADYRRNHPLDVASLRVCGPANAHGSGGGLSGAAGVHGSGSQGSAAGQVGQPVHPGDSPSAEYRLRLLDAFGALFDDTDRQVDGLQTRLGIKP